MDKPYRALYDGEQPLIEQLHFTAKEACIYEGLVCGTCYKSRTDKLRTCGKCHKVAYCNVSCQRQDWKRHKKSCGKNPFILNPDGSAENSRKEALEEYVTVRRLVKEHPFPSFSEISSKPSFYTQDIHDRLAVIYSIAGYLSFKHKARTLGEYLDNKGGFELMQYVYTFYERLLATMFTGVAVGNEWTMVHSFCTRMMDFAWSQIGGWMV